MKKKYLLILSMFLFSLNSVFAQKLKEPKMVFVEGGEFQMGSETGESDERPVHKVQIKDFYISKTEITVEQFLYFCEETGWPKPQAPIWGLKNEFPVVNVSWKDAGAYALWLSRKTGKKYRLPTEAEWEYAAMGGKQSQKAIYSGGNDIYNFAWYFETTYASSPQPVATLQSNELGLYDMSGNVWEWCKDSYSWKYHLSEEGHEYFTAGGNYRVVRGGGWDSEDKHCRIANRDRDMPDSKKDNIGFRIVYSD